LHEASAYGTPEVVRLLLEHGANVEKNNNGRTPHQTISGTPRDKAFKLKLLKEFSVQGITSQGSTTFRRSTTQHSQRSGRQTRYLRHVSSSSVLDRSDQSDTDLSSDISLSATTSGSTA
jgi:ankyrin repeat protein